MHTSVKNAKAKYWNVSVCEIKFEQQLKYITYQPYVKMDFSFESLQTILRFSRIEIVEV